MDLLIRYWDMEPWGPWRDNFHAAVISRAVYRTVTNDQVNLDQFMFHPVEEMDPIEVLRSFGAPAAAGK